MEEKKKNEENFAIFPEPLEYMVRDYIVNYGRWYPSIQEKMVDADPTIASYFETYGTFDEVLTGISGEPEYFLRLLIAVYLYTLKIGIVQDEKTEIDWGAALKKILDVIKLIDDPEAYLPQVVLDWWKEFEKKLFDEGIQEILKELKEIKETQELFITERWDGEKGWLATFKNYTDDLAEWKKKTDETLSVLPELTSELVCSKIVGQEYAKYDSTTSYFPSLG